MCDPGTLALATFAISAAGAATSYMAQSQVADAQTAQWNQNYVNALASARDDQMALTTRQEQESDATTQKLQASQVDQAERQSQVSVAAAQGGVSGISVGNIMADVANKAEQNRTNDTINYQNTAQQLQQEKDATNDTAENRINSMMPGVQPSLLATGVQIAGSAVSAYTGYSKRMQ